MCAVHLGARDLLATAEFFRVIPCSFRKVPPQNEAIDATYADDGDGEVRYGEMQTERKRVQHRTSCDNVWIVRIETKSEAISGRLQDEFGVDGVLK